MLVGIVHSAWSYFYNTPHLLRQMVSLDLAAKAAIIDEIAYDSTPDKLGSLQDLLTGIFLPSLGTWYLPEFCKLGAIYWFNTCAIRIAESTPDRGSITA